MNFKRWMMLVIAAGAGWGGANPVITFSGAENSPLTMTLSEDITFSETGPGADVYAFVLLDVATGDDSLSSDASGTLRWADVYDPNQVLYVAAFDGEDQKDVVWGGGVGSSGSGSTIVLLAGKTVTDASCSFIWQAGTAQLRALDGEYRYVGNPVEVTVAVPEPASALLLVLGCGSVAVCRRWSRRWMN